MPYIQIIIQSSRIHILAFNNNFFIVLLLLGLWNYSFSKENNAQSLKLHVIDVDAGLCAIVEAPDSNGNPQYLVFDTGKRAVIKKKLKEILPNDSLSYLVISHPDDDHYFYARYILENYHVETIIRSGFDRKHSTQWADYRSFIDTLSTIKKHINQNARKTPTRKDKRVRIGKKFSFGDAKVTLMSGFGNKYPWMDKIKLNDKEDKNSISIVLKIEYAGKSILLTGDIVGTHNKDPKHAVASEEFLLENQNRNSLDIDVLVVPHHGGDNACSISFLKAVTPSIVIFPSGKKYKHPHKDVAKRIIALESVKKIFRTDYGSNIGGDEWDWKNTTGGAGDDAGDDDVLVEIFPDGTITSKYKNSNNIVWSRD